jgi:hypothetical protein
MKPKTPMSSAASEAKSGQLTVEEVTALAQTLFDDRALRVPVDELEGISVGLYLWAVVFHARDLHEARESSDQNWQTAAWDFGRFAKAHPRLIELDSDQALLTVKRMIGTEFWTKYLDMDAADAEMAFDGISNDCKAIPGYDPVTVAIMKAKRIQWRESMTSQPGTASS